MKQCKLTTTDNPFDPFEDFHNWWLFDTEKGYDCCSKLDRIIKVKDDFTEIEIHNAEEQAIDEIIKHDFTDTYKKVVKNYKEVDDNSEDF